MIHFVLSKNPQESGGHKKNENKKKEKGSKNSSQPAMNGAEATKPAPQPEQVEKLKGEITVQGDKVRNLKTSEAAKVLNLNCMHFKMCKL